MSKSDIKQAIVGAQLTKVDVARRLVYGVITSGSTDKSAEKMDYETSKPYFSKWSDTISKATDGKSLGNLRLMHQPVAVGKLVSLEFDDDQQEISVCGKVTDDEVWKMVEEGVLTGFSIGGRYVRKWDDPDEPGTKKFTVNPAETSLVDNPCNGDCHFTAVKADGTEEQREFKAAKEALTDMFVPSNEAVEARAKELAKAASGTQWTDHIEAATAVLKSEHGEGDPEPAAAEVEEPAGEDAAAAEAAAGEGGDPPAAEELSEEEQKEAAAKAVAAANKPKPGKTGTDAPKPDTSAAAASDPSSDEDKGVKDPPGKKAKEAGKTVVSEEDRLRLAGRVTQAQLWKASDDTMHATKALAIAHEATLDAAPPASAVDVALAKALGQPGAGGPEAEAAVLEIVPGITKVIAIRDAVRKAWEDRRDAETDEVRKCLYTVSLLADNISSLRWVLDSAICEAAYEKDGSPVPGQLMDGIRTLGAALVAMAREEVEEMIADMQSTGVSLQVFEAEGEAVVVELSALADGVMKISAPLLEGVEKITAARAPAAEPELQKLVGEDGALIEGEELTKLAETSPVIKALLAQRDESRAEVGRLGGEVEKAVSGIESLGARLAETQKLAETLGQQPAPQIAARTSVIAKGVEVTHGADGSVSREEAMKAVTALSATPEGREMLTQAAIRASQESGTHIR